jgi:hypothetical protein
VPINQLLSISPLYLSQTLSITTLLSTSMKSFFSFYIWVRICAISLLYLSSSSTTRNILMERKLRMQRVVCNPIFFTVRFTIDKMWNQPTCPVMNKENVEHMHNWILFIQPEMKACLCSNMSNAGGHYIERNITYT